MSEIVACVFDAYGTLLNVHAPADAVTAELGAEGPALSQTWRQKQLEYSWLRSLMGRHADFWQVTEDALDFALERHGLAGNGLRTRLLELYRDLAAYPDVRPCLERLRSAGLKTAVLSNATPAMLARALESAGLTALLDAVLSIESVGVYKPVPRVYELATAQFGVPAERIGFVSCNTWDVAGAAAFGLHVVRLDRFKMPLDRLPGTPKASVDGLDELAGALGL